MTGKILEFAGGFTLCFLMNSYISRAVPSTSCFIDEIWGKNQFASIASIPQIEISSGIFTPNELERIINPFAISSLAEIIAVGIYHFHSFCGGLLLGRKVGIFSGSIAK